MIVDTENNYIYLAETPNSHLLIMGQSGSGKTYYCNRKIEQEIQKGKGVLIFDYSGSFTVNELKRANFAYCAQVNYKNPIEDEVVWHCPVNNYISVITNALIKSLRLRSYYQRKLLKEGIERIGRRKKFTIAILMITLEKMLAEKEDVDEKNNIGHLLTRLAPYEELDGIKIDFIEEYLKDTDIEIIQLSEYGEMERKFVTEFLSEICWQEVRQNKKHSDIIVFDEFQFLSVKPGSALSGILREGRKFSLSVYMSSQFLGDYSQEEVDTLMQAGNILFFKPVPKERKQIAKYIDGQNYKSWDRILDNLKVGEAVLKGHFMINSNKTEVTCPIKCIIQKSKK